MGEQGNGHDPMMVRTLEVLSRIETKLEAIRVDLTDRIDGTNARINALKTITENAFRHVHERIDEAHEEAIASTEKMGGPEGVLARLERLEAAVFKKTG